MLCVQVELSNCKDDLIHFAERSGHLYDLDFAPTPPSTPHYQLRVGYVCTGKSARSQKVF